MAEWILLGDIGGTNSRFALAAWGKVKLRAERHYENAGFASFQDVIETYFTDIGERAGSAVVAIAGPVAGELIGPTNLPRWRFRPPSLRAALRFSRLDVINDFEAVAHALPHLSEDQAVPIGTIDRGISNGNLAVLGPGTGLGVGALVRDDAKWVAVPSEGGHAEIGAPMGEWARVHEAIHRQLGRVSGEHVLSGSGLERIDSTLRDLNGDTRRFRAAEISSLALARSDPIALEACRLFFDYLARFSGDVALMFGAKGGIFLYGGVCQKLAPLLDETQFRTSFKSKSPMEPFLEIIPTKLIIAPTPGLIGCAAIAEGWPKPT